MIKFDNEPILVMMRWLLFLTILAISIACSGGTDLKTAAIQPLTLPATDPSLALPETSPTPEEPKYLGVTIDELFPMTTHSSSIDDNGREEDQNVKVGGYTMRIKEYVPQTLVKDGQVRFTFKKRQREGYWGTVIGVSHLRGQNNSEIYAAVSGPGGVCCTNYSIVDISSFIPRSIFHSEDFGHFRNPMEVFDVDGDGVYELVQFDSCMRYFMDDCGSCSPEPRVHFKYDHVRGQYLPAAGIQQEFVREGMAETKKWIEDEFKKWESTHDIQTRFELDRTLRSYVADLLHLGNEKEAWKMFERFGDDSSGKERREIKKRLAGCKFYQALRKSFVTH